MNDIEPEEMLLELLKSGYIIINDHWWKHDDVRINDYFSVSINCSDAFGYGADAEEFVFSELEEVYSYYMKDAKWGTTAFVIKKRGHAPMDSVAAKFESENAGGWTVEELTRINE